MIAWITISLNGTSIQCLRFGARFSIDTDLSGRLPNWPWCFLISFSSIIVNNSFRATTSIFSYGLPRKLFSSWIKSLASHSTIHLIAVVSLAAFRGLMKLFKWTLHKVSIASIGYHYPMILHHSGTMDAIQLSLASLLDETLNLSILWRIDKISFFKVILSEETACYDLRL